MKLRALPILLGLAACSAETETLDGPALQQTPDAGTMTTPPDPPEPPSIVATYTDPCECAATRCCPDLTIEFRPGDEARHYFLCGDAIECQAAAVGWEEQLDDGTWSTVWAASVSDTGGFLCAPETVHANWGNGIPFPPAGRVRAVALFADECGDDRLSCNLACENYYEVRSEPIEVPPESGITDG